MPRMMQPYPVMRPPSEGGVVGYGGMVGVRTFLLWVSVTALGCDVQPSHAPARAHRAPGATARDAAPETGVVDGSRLDAALDGSHLDSAVDAQADTAGGDTAPADAAPICGDAGALTLYERKIAPLFADDRPSTCSQCHLPGVDLGLFARGTPCETFACLSEQGLVDAENPSESVILSWIGRAEPESSLITAATIAEEHTAFAQWIDYTVGCGTCQNAECPRAAEVTCERSFAVDGEVDLPAVDPGGCSSPALEVVFQAAVYEERGRCSPCHYADSEDETAPGFIEVAFDCDEASLRTLNNMLRAGYVNLSQPDLSLLLLKPLAEGMGGLPHGGGDKFSGPDDPGYRSMKYFIERYAACQPQ
jgi:hypothetical protein